MHETDYLEPSEQIVELLLGQALKFQGFNNLRHLLSRIALLGRHRETRGWHYLIGCLRRNPITVVHRLDTLDDVHVVIEIEIRSGVVLQHQIGISDLVAFRVQRLEHTNVVATLQIRASAGGFPFPGEFSEGSEDRVATSRPNRSLPPQLSGMSSRLKIPSGWLPSSVIGRKDWFWSSACRINLMSWEVSLKA